MSRSPPGRLSPVACEPKSTVRDWGQRRVAMVETAVRALLMALDSLCACFVVEEDVINRKEAVRERESMEKEETGKREELELESWKKKKIDRKKKRFFRTHPSWPCCSGERRNFFVEARQRWQASRKVGRGRDSTLGEMRRTGCGDPVLSLIMRRTLRRTGDRRRRLRRIIRITRSTCGACESTTVLKDEQRRSCDGRFRSECARGALLWR